MTPAVILGWLEVARKLWELLAQKSSKVSDATMEKLGFRRGADGKWYRPRPPGPPAFVALVALGYAMATCQGCAGPLEGLQGDDLMQACLAVVPPCEPCPDAPVPPPAPPPAPPVPTPPPVPDPPPVPPPEGNSPQSLWKPLSDSQPPRAFWITGSGWDFAACSLVTRKKKRVVSTYRPPRANGGRQHWDFGRPGAEYGRQILITCTGASGTHSWTVPNGAQRWETR